MKISYIDYSPKTKSLDIFFSGCNPPYCKDCYNSELVSFDCGTDWRLWLDKIEQYCHEYSGLIENIFLLGGSATHQDINEMYEFLSSIFLLTNQEIWLFAREELSDVPEFFKGLCAYIKCGEYIPKLICDNNIQYGIKLATSNQKIYKKGVDY